MGYKEKKILLRNWDVTFRGAGWQGCLNFLPYLVIRKNPLRPDWKDFSVEFGWLVWAAGIRFGIGIYN